MKSTAGCITLNREEDAILCSCCVTAVQLKIPMRGYMDTVFSTSGFVNKACMHCDAHSMVAAASFDRDNECGHTTNYKC